MYRSACVACVRGPSLAVVAAALPIASVSAHVLHTRSSIAIGRSPDGGVSLRHC